MIPPHSDLGCPGADLLECIARGEAVESPTADHVATCEGCGTRVRDFRANLEFLRVITPSLATREPTATGTDSGGASERHAQADLVPGYTILRELARGSQGIVYLAVQDRTKRPTAVKMLLQGTFATERQRRRFEHEIEVAAALRHPGIVTVYDSTPVRGGRLAYAMEYIEHGVPVDAWAAGREGHSPPDIRMRLSLIARVCDAVQHAHLRGVIHRDLKPANILIDRTDQPHILDFGIAKTLGSSEHHQTLTGEIVGTPAYASPEQFSGQPGTVDTRTDVYSLGVVLYELLTGRLPYAVGSVVEAARNIREAAPSPLPTTAVGIDRDLETIVLRALEKAPERRYQSAGALGRDVEHLLAGEPIEARRDGVWYVVRRAAVRHRVAVLAGAMVAGAIGIGGAAATVSLLQARTATTNEAAAKRIAKIEQSRAASESARAQAVAAVLNELAPPWDTGFASDADHPARRVIDRVATRLDAGLHSGRPEVEVATRRLLGDVYRDHGMPEDAESQYATALVISQTSLARDHTTSADLTIELAGLLAERGETASAVRMLDGLLKETPADEGSARSPLSSRAAVFLALGQVHLLADELDHALVAANRVLDLGDALGAPERADAREIVARVLAQRDDLAGAIAEATDAIMLRFGALGDGHPSLVPNLELLAGLYERAGAVDGADGGSGHAGVYRGARFGVFGPADSEEHRQGLMKLSQVRSHVFQGDRGEVAQTFFAVAQIHSGVFDHGSAVRCLEEAMFFFRRESVPPKFAMAACMGSMAHELAALGRLGEAEGASAVQLACLREIGAPAELLTWPVRARRAGELARLGRSNAAIEAYTSLLDDPDASLPRRQRAAAMVRLASLYTAANNYAMAEDWQRRAEAALGTDKPDIQLRAEMSLVAATLSLFGPNKGIVPSAFDESYEQWRPLMSSWRNYRTLVATMRTACAARGGSEAEAQLASILEEPDRVSDQALVLTDPQESSALPVWRP